MIQIEDLNWSKQASPPLCGAFENSIITILEESRLKGRAGYREMTDSLDLQNRTDGSICKSRKTSQKSFAFLVRTLASKKHALKHRMFFEPKLEHEIRFANFWFYGGVAQLGEHLPCKQGVMSSNLTISTQQLSCWNLHIDNCILTENCLNRQKT